jgi:uncharacterized OB-fold protein
MTITTAPDVAAPYWEGLRQGEIRFQRCGQCSNVVFIPRAFCPYCLAGEDALTWHVYEGTGTLYTYSTIHSPPTAEYADKVPYTLGFVELDEGYFLFGEIEGDEFEIGTRLSARVEPRGEQHLVVFAPA